MRGVGEARFHLNQLLACESRDRGSSSSNPRLTGIRLARTSSHLVFKKFKCDFGLDGSINNTTDFVGEESEQCGRDHGGNMAVTASVCCRGHGSEDTPIPSIVCELSTS